MVDLAKYSGTEVKIDGEEHLIVDADDILGWWKVSRGA